MYQFTYRTNAKDIWAMFMYNTYGSLVGVCNIIFTAAMIVLIAAKWTTAGAVFRILMLLGLCMFTVIQPIVVWSSAVKWAQTVQNDTELSFDDKGIHICVDQQRQSLPWKADMRIAKKPTMLIVYTSPSHGYLLTNKVLGGQRKAFYQYAVGMMEAQKK